MSSNHQERYQIGATGILMLLFFPLTLPDFFQNISIINNLSTLIVGIMFLYLCVLSFIKKQFNIFVVISFIFVVWRMLSSYYLSNGVLDLVNSFRIITLILLVNMTIKSYPRSTLKALSTIFGLYIVINFITIFVFPQGLYVIGKLDRGWFLGIENQFALILIPGITLIILSSWYNYSEITKWTWVQTAITLLTVLKIWSATAIVSVVFVIGSLILNLRKKIKPMYSFSLLSIIYLVLWLVLVRFNSMDSFQTIIVDILNKDLTLSFRTNIWSTIFEVIPDSLWYGYGINSVVKAGVITYFAAHNMVLQTILDSGLIGLFLLLICIIIPGFKLQKIKSNRITVILLIGIFGVLIGGLAESYRYNYLFLLLTLSYNINYIIKKYELTRKITS